MHMYIVVHNILHHIILYYEGDPAPSAAAPPSPAADRTSSKQR